MKKDISIISVFLVCLIVPLSLVIAVNSQEQKQVEKQNVILKEAKNIVEELEEWRKEAKKYFKQVEPAQKRISFNKSVLSFDTLDKVEKCEDLPKYGLVAPEQYNHKSGKNLVLLALKATSWFKGDWLMAHGLLGTNMLDVNVHDKSGYKSLFLSLTQRFKMYASYLNDDNTLLTSLSKPHKSLKSIIAKREASIYLISTELNGRYVYNNMGNFGRNYLPEKNRDSHKKLKQLLIDGLKVYGQLKEQGFDDKTLKDVLGMAYASLDYDGIYLSVSEIRQLGVLQIYSDALIATLIELKEKPNHSYEFLEKLGWEMQARNLSTFDDILAPSDDKNHLAILKIVEADLNQIRQPQTKATDAISDTKETSLTEQKTASSNKTSTEGAKTIFIGFPKKKVSEGGLDRVVEDLSRKKAVNLRCVISKIKDKYYWASRENVEMVKIERAGALITFLAVNGSGYVRVIKPELKEAASLMSKTEESFDYVEHLTICLRSVNYWGEKER
jgi:hypothetical protein